MNYAIITSHDNSLSTLWLMGWIFTIGFLKLTFWKGVLAFIIWPYYLGVHFRKPAAHHVSHLEEPKA